MGMIVIVFLLILVAFPSNKKVIVITKEEHEAELKQKQQDWVDRNRKSLNTEVYDVK